MDEHVGTGGTWSVPTWLIEWINLAAVSLLLALVIHHFFLRGQRNNEKGSGTVGQGQTLGRNPQATSKDILSELQGAQALAPSPPSILNLTVESSNLVADLSSADEWDNILHVSSKTSRPVVAKFTATWCKPCQEIDPFFVSLAAEYNAKFLRVDVDDFDEIAADCSVSSMPTFVVLMGKKTIGRATGIDKRTLENLCMKHCTAPKFNDTGGNGAEVSESDPSSLASPAAVAMVEIDSPDEGGFREEHDPCQSPAEHPGLESFHGWHAALSEKFRSYSIATTCDVSPPVLDSKITQSTLRVVVTNSMSFTIEAYKVNRGGTETLVGSFAPGRTMRSSDAFLGQQWAFREKGKENVMVFFVPHQASFPSKDGPGLYKFFILPPGLTAKQEGRVCDISDPIFPFPSTKISNVSRAVGCAIQEMEREWADAASKTAYYRAPQTVLKYLRNIIKAPSELKYRRIRMENAVFRGDVWNTAGKGVLLALGFEVYGEFMEMGGPLSVTKERLGQVTDAIAQLDAFVRGKTELSGPAIDHEEQDTVSEGIKNLFSGLEDDLLLRNGVGGEQERVILRDALAGKEFVLLYASAHWCPPCRRFTPRLIQFYGMADSLEVVFLSADRSLDQFQSYFATMPWLAVPFESAAKQKIMNSIQVRGIPRLCVIDVRTGKIVEDNAVGMPLDIERWRALRNAI